MQTPEDELIHRLMRPTFVLNMARWGEHQDSPHGRSCRTRANNARAAIHQAVKDYMAAKYGTCSRCHRLLDEAGVCWFHTP